MNDPQALVDRYVAIWNEPDATRRRAAIEAHGCDELATRVLRPHQRWVVHEGCVFRAVPRDGGEVISEGRDFFLLDPEGRVRSIYQFITR